ncbi:MAG: transmembrane 220 family protein, partial [Acidobacteriota bacterium]
MAVQYNDPDPFRWMFLYAAAAVCCILFALRNLPVYLPVATAIVAGLWILLLLPAVWGQSIPLKEVFSMIHM